MDVEILSRSTLKPSSPTPQNLRNFKLNFLDQFTPETFIPLIYYYDSKITPSNISEAFENLKTSFAETLTIYYPLAGRLSENLTAIDCNDRGALFIEAQTDCSLSQFLEKPNMASLNKFLPCMGLSVGVDCDALAAVQVTMFKCGSVAIGACIDHKVVDISGMSGFIKNWAKISCGLKDQVDYPDLYSSSQLFPAITFDPKFGVGFENFFHGGPKNIMVKRFVFDAKTLATLQTLASSNDVPHPSRIAALTSFICKRMMAAREMEEGESQPLMITHTVNLRRRIEPPLPDNSFGNSVWLAYGVCDPTEDKIELSDLVQVVKEMLININNESIRELSGELVLAAMTDLLENMEAMEKLQTLKFTCWCNIGAYDANFGWGEPVWVSFMGDSYGFRTGPGFILMDTKSEKGIEVWMAFDEKSIIILENDAKFLEYANLNPSISMS